MAETPVKFEKKLFTITLWNWSLNYLFTIKFLLPSGGHCPILDSVFMGCFPCDTRLEAFPPYLSRVRSLARLLSFNLLKRRFCRFRIESGNEAGRLETAAGRDQRRRSAGLRTGWPEQARRRTVGKRGAFGRRPAQPGGDRRLGGVVGPVPGSVRGDPLARVQAPGVGEGPCPATGTVGIATWDACS
jgi:hypothetical protein